jgi:hypothetical protein
MDAFGSALPENKNRPAHQLVVTETTEYDFGWVYFYNSREYMETGDHLRSFVGNAPLIFCREDGKLYETGTGHPLEHFIAEFRSGKRYPL